MDVKLFHDLSSRSSGPEIILLPSRSTIRLAFGFIFNMETSTNEALIAAVQKRPPLYDKNCDMYSNRPYLNRQWNKIAEEVGIDGKSFHLLIQSSLSLLFPFFISLLPVFLCHSLSLCLSLCLSLSLSLSLAQCFN